MMPIANVFRAGHRIGLEIACDDRALVEGGRGWLSSLFPSDPDRLTPLTRDDDAAVLLSTGS